jgi:hypothetical protein
MEGIVSATMSEDRTATKVGPAKVGTEKQLENI